MSTEISVQDINSKLISTKMDNINNSSKFEKYLTTKDFKEEGRGKDHLFSISLSPP